MNIINFKIINEIVFKGHKIFIIIEIDGNQRFNKIVINKFVRKNTERYKIIIRNHFLIIHHITFAGVFLDNVFEKIYIYNDIKKLIEVLLI